MTECSRDEAFTLYSFLAKKVEVGLFTIKLLKDKGIPPFDRYMKRIESTEKIGDHGIRIRFPHLKDREFSLLLAGGNG
ncbi:hypothetical protein [Bartonella florencae]|uniref:hypothetical protein n=1 Tax=Bartonella florencae TaxID=928210 RepID=UPI0002EA6DEE|nr:hypothetical protein [Bartonella florencae]